MTAEFYIANRIRKATIKQNSPMASDRANPRMAYENSCCFRDGFLPKRTTRSEKTRRSPEFCQFKSILVFSGCMLSRTYLA